MHLSCQNNYSNTYLHIIYYEIYLEAVVDTPSTLINRFFIRCNILHHLGVGTISMIYD